MKDAFDLLLAGSTVLDPASGLPQELDIGVVDGRIAAIQPSLPRKNAKQVLEVRGGYVTPGLIDFHIHSYWGVNPYGFNADPICVGSGVTTAVDAGSAGPVNFTGFKRFIAEQSRTRMLAFVCVAQHGVLSSPGELRDLGFADPEGAVRTVKEHPDVAVGIKVRLQRSSVGDNGLQALRLAIQAGEASRSPVMVHIGDTAISMEEIVDTLRPGEVVPHCFTLLKHISKIIDHPDNSNVIWLAAQGPLVPKAVVSWNDGNACDTTRCKGRADISEFEDAVIGFYDDGSIILGKSGRCHEQCHHEKRANGCFHFEIVD